MNSLNKHVPTIVFCIGLFLLIFSIRTFFHAGKSPNMTPIVNSNVQPREAPTIRFRPQTRPAPAMSRLNSRDETLKLMKKPAADYLARHGLKMNIPDDYAFFEEADGPVSVLVGASAPGRNDLFFFSVKGRYNADRATSYLREYMADEMKITPKGSAQSFYSRGGFSDMSQMRGVTNKGGEYQAYFFTSKKGSESHMLVLMNKQLIKSPARLREIVDSVSRAR